jgi:hypothetical protein
MLQPKSLETAPALIAPHGDLGNAAVHSTDRPQTMQKTKPEFAF